MSDTSQLGFIAGVNQNTSYNMLPVYHLLCHSLQMLMCEPKTRRKTLALKAHHLRSIINTIQCKAREKTWRVICDIESEAPHSKLQHTLCGSIWRSVLHPTHRKGGAVWIQVGHALSKHTKNWKWSWSLKITSLSPKCYSACMYKIWFIKRLWQVLFLINMPTCTTIVMYRKLLCPVYIHIDWPSWVVDGHLTQKTASVSF